MFIQSIGEIISWGKFAGLLDGIKNLVRLEVGGSKIKSAFLDLDISSVLELVKFGECVGSIAGKRMYVMLVYIREYHICSFVYDRRGE